jgi:FAD/FMN-containing dehydrogenase
MPYQAIDDDEKKFYKEIEEIYFSFEGRVSWARLFWADHEKIKQSYPEMDKFLAVKLELDPNNLFSNKWTNRVLGLK